MKKIWKMLVSNQKSFCNYFIVFADSYDEAKEIILQDIYYRDTDKFHICGGELDSELGCFFIATERR